MLAVTVRHGIAALEDVAGTLESLQKVVGGYIEPFFTAASPTEPELDITGYVNEEGLMIGLPLAFGAYHHSEYCVPLAGDAVIIGLDSATGETRGLTEREASRVLKAFRVPTMGLIPVIEGPREAGAKTMLVPVRSVLHLPCLNS